MIKKKYRYPPGTDNMTIHIHFPISNKKDIKIRVLAIMPALHQIDTSHYVIMSMNIKGTASEYYNELK